MSLDPSDSIDPQARLREAWFFFAASHIQAGQTALAVQRSDEALASFRKAAELDPSNLAAWGGAGEACRQLGDEEGASQAFAHLVDLAGSNPGDLGHLAGRLFGHGWSYAALALWQAAQARDPQFAAWPANQAVALKRLGRSEEARQQAWAALKLDPGCDAANRLLGELAEEAGDLAGAIRHFQAVAVPDAPMLSHLAQTHLLMGDGVSAAHVYRRAADLDSAFASAALMALHYCPDLPVGEIVSRHLAWGKHFPVPDAPPWRHKDGQPLRLGFVSADFRHHATGIFLPPLLARRQRCGWQAVLYSNTRTEDGFTEKFKSLCDGWRDIRNLNDADAAELVKSDAIDILIDLNGHTAGNRLGIFALRPAPVQMAYLDYVCTTGLKQIDYRLHDRIHLLPEEAALYSEKPLWMEGDIFVYEPPAYAPEVAPAPCLQNGFVTFASFNAAFKIGEPTIALWGAIMKEIPDAHFLMASPNFKYPAAMERMKNLFGKYGVSSERVTLLGEADHREQLARYAMADLVLDSLPYSGGLTTCEAMWMGVPVITLSGKSVAGRHSTSHLTAVGHSELITGDAESYIQLACGLARSHERLSSLRRRLREEMRHSVLCDLDGYSDCFTKALREINYSGEK
ncbi:MAG: tetratricopeptide repeat protein [Rhodospirillales bacterium]|nr:MAG: tetratricopeptide repeat protein [Rhodospirillales bacterium]